MGYTAHVGIQITCDPTGLDQAADRVSSALEKMLLAADRVNAATSRWNQSLNQSAGHMRTYTGSIRGMLGAVRDGTAATRDATDALKSTTAATKDSLHATKQTARAARETAGAVRSSTSAVRDANRAMTASSKASGDAARTLGQTATRMAASGRQIERAMRSSFGGAASSVTRSTRSMSSSLNTSSMMARKWVFTMTSGALQVAHGWGRMVSAITGGLRSIAHVGMFAAGTAAYTGARVLGAGLGYNSSVDISKRLIGNYLGPGRAEQIIPSIYQYGVYTPWQTPQLLQAANIGAVARLDSFGGLDAWVQRAGAVGAAKTGPNGEFLPVSLNQAMQIARYLNSGGMGQAARLARGFGIGTEMWRRYGANVSQQGSRMDFSKTSGQEMLAAYARMADQYFQPGMQSISMSYAGRASTLDEIVRKIIPSMFSQAMFSRLGAGGEFTKWIDKIGAMLDSPGFTSMIDAFARFTNAGLDKATEYLNSFADFVSDGRFERFLKNATQALKDLFGPSVTALYNAASSFDWKKAGEGIAWFVKQIMGVATMLMNNPWALYPLAGLSVINNMGLSQMAFGGLRMAFSGTRDVLARRLGRASATEAVVTTASNAASGGAAGGVVAQLASLLSGSSARQRVPYPQLPTRDAAAYWGRWAGWPVLDRHVVSRLNLSRGAVLADTTREAAGIWNPYRAWVSSLTPAQIAEASAHPASEYGGFMGSVYRNQAWVGTGSGYHSAYDAAFARGLGTSAARARAAKIAAWSGAPRRAWTWFRSAPEVSAAARWRGVGVGAAGEAIAAYSNYRGGAASGDMPSYGGGILPGIIGGGLSGSAFGPVGTVIGAIAGGTLQMGAGYLGTRRYIRDMNEQNRKLGLFVNRTEALDRAYASGGYRAVTALGESPYASEEQRASYEHWKQNKYRTNWRYRADADFAAYGVGGMFERLGAQAIANVMGPASNDLSAIPGMVRGEYGWYKMPTPRMPVLSAPESRWGYGRRDAAAKAGYGQAVTINVYANNMDDINDAVGQGLSDAGVPIG